MIEGLIREISYFMTRLSTEKIVKRKISNKYIRFLVWLIIGIGVLYLYDYIEVLIKGYFQ